MGAFVISKRFNDEYKFVFTSGKGKVIFTSLSYELKYVTIPLKVDTSFRSKVDSSFDDDFLD
jgi:hypothetical protein